MEYSNIVFSAIFAAEMVLKVIAEGPCGYVSNGFNVFDGIIVILRYARVGRHRKRNEINRTRAYRSSVCATDGSNKKQRRPDKPDRSLRKRERER